MAGRFSLPSHLSHTSGAASAAFSAIAVWFPGEMSRAISMAMADSRNAARPMRSRAKNEVALVACSTLWQQAKARPLMAGLGR